MYNHRDNKEFFIKFIADFHIHSHYSIATSKNLIPELLHKWALLKGITVIGTGDFTHPGWTKELIDKLEPAEQGLFKLKSQYMNSDIISDNFNNKKVRFILTAEISSIYKKNDRVRKIHNLIFAPDFESIKKIQNALSKIGNITSDGRPILGLDAKNLLDMVLNANDDCFLIPAHIWTPWFSALGSNSGFDSIEECFEDLTDKIFAIETGLSSDPPMNWACSFLDKFTIISNSDAHNPENLGREANILDTDLSYYSIRDSLKTRTGFSGTIEFFPQEGKYHFDGHRKCGICFDPIESIKNNNTCPVCKKKLTLGVMYRVAELSDRDNPLDRKNKSPFYSLIQLKELLSEIYGTSSNSKKVNESYMNLLKTFGSEFDILLNIPIEELKTSKINLLPEAVKRMREGNVIINEGFDGEYGRIKVFNENELKDISQNDLFNFNTPGNDNTITQESKNKYNEINFKEFKILKSKFNNQETFIKSDNENKQVKEGLNPSQLEAVQYKGNSLIIAGPGTGKTKTLTSKIIDLVNSNINPENILSLTFSNNAAKEILERVKLEIKDNSIIEKLIISTFHSFGLRIIEENLNVISRTKNHSIIDDKDKETILKEVLLFKHQDIKKLINDISVIKQQLVYENQIEDIKVKESFIKYNEYMNKNNLFDFDDLLYLSNFILDNNPQILKNYHDKYKWINIDEYQDINYSQYMLIKKISGKDCCVTAIGDPNQAIYGFRGASVDYINKFIIDYPDAKTFYLETSYRCSNYILNASNEILKQKNKYFLKGLDDGIKINIKEFNSNSSEAEFVARQVELMIGGLRFFSIDSGITDGSSNYSDLQLSDFAILCRANSQMDYIEKSFNDHAISYQKFNEDGFLKEEPFITIINLIKYFINPENQFLKNILSKSKLDDNKLNEFLTIFNNNSLQNVIKFIIENLFKELQSKNKEQFDELYKFAKECNNDIHTFINNLSLYRSIDFYKKDNNAVKLMTIHSAKGLEFKCVFIIGCNEKYLPFSLYENYKADIEEEKRLLYVGMTRAKKYLYLTYSKKINHFGSIINVSPSPFIENIKSELMDFEKQKFIKKNKDDGQLSLF